MQYHRTTQKCRPLEGKAETAVAIAELQGALKLDIDAVALAAPQLGNNVRAFIVRRLPDIGGLFINPTVKIRSVESFADYEGCRSLPELGHIKKNRYKSITIEYTDINGNRNTRTFHGYASAIVQHEMDHLDGVMIACNSNSNT